MNTVVQTTELRTPRAPWALFTAFSWLALQGFGGVLPVAQRELVERQRWLTREDFLELLSLCQVLPGPNVVNLSLIFGQRCFGWRGAVAACAGMLAAPTAIVLVLALLFAGWSDVPQVAGAVRGMGVVAAGLVVATALKLLPALRKNALGLPLALAFAAATAAAVGVLRLPLVAVVLGLGGVAVAAAAWRLRA
jgi:chromate transporter